MEQQLNNNDRFVFPGQVLNVSSNSKINNQSFYEENGQVKSLYFGLLNIRDIGGHPYLSIAKKAPTYIPEKNHFVIGVIKSKVGDNFIVDINAPVDATLGGLQFDGATKRNKPNLSAGDLVFTRVAQYSKFIGAKLSCINAGYSAKNALSELKGGMIVYGLSGREHIVQNKIETIKKYCQFEVAFGKNDILWFSCTELRTEMVLYNIFTEILKGCSEELFQTLVKMLQK